MGKKKSKEREASQGGGPVSSQSDIFKTLFGNVEEQNAAASSLFSDSNPFRRKPQEAVLAFVSTESTKVPDGIDLLDAGNAELKQPKRKKEKEKYKNRNLGSDEEAAATESPSEAKKSRKMKTLDSESKSKALKEETQKLNVGLESNGDLERKEKGEKPSSDFDKNALESRKNPGSVKGREKRKRDELEREYEMRKYGKAPAEDEGGFGGKVAGQKRKKADDDDEVDALLPKEGFDDENKLLRTVFVGNLPLNVKKKMLMKEFSKFGEVESVRIRSVPLADTKKPRKGAIMQKKINEKADSVHAYVVFKTEQSAEASLAHNMAVVAGNHIRVDRACPPRKKLKGENALLYDNKRTVFVGNLPFDVKDEEIYQLFCSINNLESSIEAVRVIRDPQFGMGKGIAYVLFKTREAANLVLKKRTLKLRDRELRLSHARPDSTPSKRKNLSNGETANSPAKKFVVDSRNSSGNKNKSNSKATMSYQGLRASKSDVNKKVHSKGNSSAKAKFTTSSGEKPKERKTKRPAVAARKAKANAGALKQVGAKRKLDNRTHESSAHKKKAKRRLW
ncbi:hypothetical protein SLEP1_g22004 [Rubroshorea leprosula]|uniref:RRM domain-containing protein n=1 Tax=Rubroshorea leprosula TaxID=152421 RepID=A0AAV5J7U5_9ROSI|nr:hypothetical protein SLEP1_g22004 [Rubroshorea leprosula]